MAAKSDYYDILGVSKGSSKEEIKKAYRKQALEWHPDRHKDDKEPAERRFKEINEAYQVLSDDKKKTSYDQFGHAAFSPGGGVPRASGGQGGFGGFPGGGQWKVHVGGSGNTAGFDFGDPFDIFEQFFGGGNPFGGRAQRLPRYSMNIEFMEAVKGIEKEVNIGGRKRKIKIPAGINEGQKIRFDNFILSVNIKPHKIFEREGDDIFIKVFVPFSTMVLGGEVKVPTIEGDVKIKIRKGMQSGTTMRLRGKGVQRLRGRGKGDQYIRLHVDVSARPTREQRKMVEEMKKKGL